MTGRGANRVVSLKSLLSIAVLVGALLAGCGGSATESAQPSTPAPTATPAQMTSQPSAFAVTTAAATPMTTPAPTATAASAITQQPTPAPSPTATVATAGSPSPAASPPPPPTATPTPSPTPVVIVKVPDEEWYQDPAFDRVLADAYGIVGVIAMEQDGTVLYSWNADAPFITASTYKIFLMATCFRLREEGKLDFWEEVYLDPSYFEGEAEWQYAPGQVGAMMSINDAVYWMATKSSNIAARSLIARVGGDEINKTIEELGLEHTRFLTMPEDLPVWPPPVSSDSTAEFTAAAVAFVEHEAVDGPVNVTTPRDMARFFELMLNEELISPEASWEMHDILADQQVGNERFPELVPGAVVHKTGDLPTVHNDVGIIWGDLGPVILISLFNDLSDQDHAAAIDRRLALLAYGGEIDWPAEVVAADTAAEEKPAEEASDEGAYSDESGDETDGGAYESAGEEESSEGEGG